MRLQLNYTWFQERMFCFHEYFCKLHFMIQFVFVWSWKKKIINFKILGSGPISTRELTGLSVGIRWNLLLVHLSTTKQDDTNSHDLKVESCYLNCTRSPIRSIISVFHLNWQIRHLKIMKYKKTIMKFYWNTLIIPGEQIIRICTAYTFLA